MNRTRWLIAGMCVAGWIFIAFALDWFTEQVAAESVKDPATLAYKPVDEMPSRVDLAAIQRDWPDSLPGRSEARELRAYLKDMEGKAPAPSAGQGPAAAPTPEPDLGTLLASADPNAGKDKVQVCKSCHDFEADNANRIGPGLYQVVGRDVGSHPGFAYSSAMAGVPGNWTYEKLYDFLAHPARTVPGTKMSFAGLRRPEDRAAVIRYLATLGGTPPPLPAPKAIEAAPAAAAPANAKAR
jgi:cytochrome c